MSVFVSHSECDCHFDSADSWVILSPIEQSIKRKIEAAGTPLKDWNINIYRGVLTGYNEAFIISGEKRNEILANCRTKEERTKTAELIRPILRGRDIKRYSYNFADLYIIATFPSRHYDIDDFPAVKSYLLSVGIERLEQTGNTHVVNGEKIKSRKKTNNKWFETQDSISYWEDFSKQKIVYREIGTEMDAVVLPENFFINNKCYMIVGEHLEYLLALFNSRLFNKFVLGYANVTGGKGVDFLEKVKVIPPSSQILREIKERLLLPDRDAQIDSLFYSLYKLTEEEVGVVEMENTSSSVVHIPAPRTH